MIAKERHTQPRTANALFSAFLIGDRPPIRIVGGGYNGLGFCRSAMRCLPSFPAENSRGLSKIAKSTKTRTVFPPRPCKSTIDNLSTFKKYKFNPQNKVISTGLNDHISVTEPVEVTVNAFCAQNSFPTLKKYKFSEQENISREFWCKPTACVQNSVSNPKGLRSKQGFALRHKTLSEAFDGFTATDKALSEASDGFTATDKALSEASDGFTATDKVLSEASDAFTATDKVLSEASDGLPATDKALSEASDGFTATNRMQSEVSDGFTAADKLLSEVYDAFTATDKLLSEASEGFTAIESQGFASLTSFFLFAPLAFLPALWTKSTKTRAYVRFLFHGNEAMQYSASSREFRA